MINLNSNGPTMDMSLIWHGADDKEINFPQVSTCVTIACLAGSKIVGCHLFYRNSADKTAGDLETFGAEAKSHGDVTWVGIVGALDNWKLASARNTTRLLMDNGTLIAKLREVLGYKGGGFAVYDTSTAGEVDILAQRTKFFVQYSFKSSGGDDAPTAIKATDMQVEV